jgi:hypothetical protein
MAESLISNDTFKTFSGTETKVIFEFPYSSADSQSLFIDMQSMITISCSVSRAKIPVIPLGQSTNSGFALGTKIVSGTGVRVVLTDDEIYKYMSAFIVNKQIETEVALLATLNPGSSGGIRSVPTKNYNDFMLDDLAEFNIHLLTISEHDKTKVTLQSILGATIINTGKILSIDNLITEETFTYVARAVKTYGNLNEAQRSIISPSLALTGTTLLAKIKGPGRITRNY